MNWFMNTMTVVAVIRVGPAGCESDQPRSGEGSACQSSEEATPIHRLPIAIAIHQSSMRDEQDIQSNQYAPR